MTNQSILALVVTNSAILQNGLLSLMTTIPHISAVLVADDTNSASRMVENHQPALIILELSSLQALDVAKKIKTQWPQIHLIALVEDITQQKAAEASGADSVLLKGFFAQKLIAIVEDVIARKVNAANQVESDAKE